jgi:anti-sigma regulatory factor (Ser/Thr protein kinase)
MLLERLSTAGRSLADQAGRVMEFALPPVPGSAGVARSGLRAYCQQHQVPVDVRDSGEIVISELVTNALVHAGTPFLVWAEYDAGQLTVAVLDGEATPPTVHPFDAGERSGGRGIPLIEALGAAWGVETVHLGKVVWVTIDPAAGFPQQRGAAPGAPLG